MPINFNDDGYVYWPDAWHTPSLGIQSAQLDNCIQEIRNRKLKGVFGTVPYFLEKNLNFLDQLTEIESAAFWDVSLNNLDAVYKLKISNTSVFRGNVLA